MIKYGFMMMGFLIVSSAFAANFPLNGTYEPVASEGCANLQLGSSRVVTISSDRNGITLAGDGSSSVSEFPVSSYEQTPASPGQPIFNGFPFVTIGGYSNGNATFKYAEGQIDLLANPNPTADSVLSGEYAITLHGSTLEIDSTVNPGEMVPAPKSICILRKI